MGRAVTGIKQSCMPFAQAIPHLEIYSKESRNMQSMLKDNHGRVSYGYEKEPKCPTRLKSSFVLKHGTLYNDSMNIVMAWND